MEIGELLRAISGELKRGADNKLREKNLTSGQVAVILELSKAENYKLSFKELEKATHTSQPVNAGVISRLEEKGLVRTCISNEDHRIKYAVLTESGLTCSSDAIEDMEFSTNQLLSALSKDEMAELKRLLGKVFDSFANWKSAASST